MLKPETRRVVFFLPAYAGPVLGPPLGLLALAGAVRSAGYEPVLIDGALDRNFRFTVLREIQDCLCFGISLLTGPMILQAIEVAKMVRQSRPDLPIIFGGWHPTLMSRQTLQEHFVDAVVRHQGELTMIEILRRLEQGKGLDLISGCWFKRGDRIIENPDRPTTPLSKLPRPAYDQIDFDAYERVSGKRKLPYATSIGCPYACNYCTDMVFYNRRFNAYDAQHVASELAELAARYRLSDVALVDSNFLVDVHRAVAIAEGILESKARFRWTFQASTDLLCRMQDEEVRLLARSGVSHIGFGTESGSPEVLRLMNKRHERVRDMFEAARKCKDAGIRVTYNLIFAYPNEEERHRKETLRVMTEIAQQFDNVSFSPNIFTPYPGIPIWPQLRQMGLEQPQCLAEWADVDLGSSRLPWLQGRSYRRLQKSVSYFLLDKEISRSGKRASTRVTRSGWLLVRKSVHWRLRNFRFEFPLELWVVFVRQWLTVRRSLLTGEPLSRELAKAR